MMPLNFAIHSLDYPLVLSFVTAIGIVILLLSCLIGACIIATSFITLIIYIICECLCWHVFEEFISDLLQRGIHRVRMLTYQAIIPNYLQPLDMIEGSPQSTDDREMISQQTLEKLLPPMIYGGDKNSFESKNCTICLDDYVVGESCRVFPECKHMFHLSCIDNWLKNHLTCPVCRRRI
ncbi:putative RING-H2 finger protein ATL19 [Durio zibethinus]|uniref:RING-type E3 ubiquitin transferase n=1 Tax=Durio zibethinus TaxID=66656 RepID=A0A6P5WPC4_DURZI|nr:putative RING-H2 finger protein ATL19 [Durio zibethinus]